MLEGKGPVGGGSDGVGSMVISSLPTFTKILKMDSMLTTKKLNEIVQKMKSSQAIVTCIRCHEEYYVLRAGEMECECGGEVVGGSHCHT